MNSLATYHLKFKTMGAKLYEANKNSVHPFVFMYVAIMFYIYIELLLNSLTTNIIVQGVILLFNLFFMAYMFKYMHTKHFNSLSSITLFVFLKYLHLVFSMTWSLSLISQFFSSTSILVAVGAYFHYNLLFFNFILNFLTSFVDYAILILFFKFAGFLLNIVNLQPYFDEGIYNLVQINLSNFIRTLHQSKLSKKIQIIAIISIICLTPVAYSDTIQTFQRTNDGIYALVDAVNILIGFFQQYNGLNGVFSSPNGLLQLKNTLYFSSKDFKIAELQLESLQSPVYAPLLLLFNGKSQTNTTLTLLNELSQFTGSTMLNLVASIENYLSLMFQLTKEILRRAYWWNLEKDNITYNPRRDFYDKFNSKTIQDLNISVNQFKISYTSLKTTINSSFLGGTSIINKLYSQLNNLEGILNQVVYLSRVAPPLLNATFTSVVVTNALAFDQFITAKNLTTLSQKYLTESQTLLSNYSFDSALSEPIAEVGKIMSEFNWINHQFFYMTYGTQNMFLNLSKSIEILNGTSYKNNMNNSSLGSINSNINTSLTYVSQIVQKNIQQITGYVNDPSASPLGFPFHDILAHFLWFYNGYSGAVDGYRNLWLTSSDTINLFHQSSELQNITLDTIESFNNTPAYYIIPYNAILTNYTKFQLAIKRIGQEFNDSVPNGAIKTNITLWENLLGYNRSLNQFQDTGFNKYAEDFMSFYNNTINLFDNSTFSTLFSTYKSSSTNFLNNLTAEGIFLSMSEQL